LNFLIIIIMVSRRINAFMKCNVKFNQTQD
jgi:hypothetical protein